MFITQNCRTHTRLFVSNVTKPVLWIHSVTLCAASALPLYYVMTFLLFFVVMHYLVFNSLYTIFLCILQLTRGTRYWSFGSVGAPSLFLGKLNK
jgi:hypothetical protein